MVKVLTETEKAYLAGFLDGEGCIGIYKRNRYKVPQYILEVTIVNTNKEVIDWIQKRVKGNIRVRRHSEWKTRWIWSINTRDPIHRFLNDILPFLIVKKKNASIALLLKKSQNPISKEERDLKEKLCQQMKVLNKRGK